jgi:hypothetical protein
MSPPATALPSAPLPARCPVVLPQPAIAGELANTTTMVNFFIVFSSASQPLLGVLVFEGPDDAHDRHLVHQGLVAGIGFGPGNERGTGILKRCAGWVADQAFECLAVADGVVILHSRL